MAVPSTKEFSTYTAVTPQGADSVLISDASDSGNTKSALISELDTALGLGTLSTQAASAIAVTGGTEDGVTYTNVDVNSGAMDGTTIGANSRAAGSFTAVTVTNDVTAGGTVTAASFVGDGSALSGVMGDDAWQGAWATSTAYSINDLVESGGSTYIATSGHTSAAATEPGVGGSWETVWDLFLSPGTGDLTGPGSSTDNAIVRFDGTGGGTVQNSGVTIDDSDHLVFSTDAAIRRNTSDASDSGFMQIAGGGAASNGRGAFISVLGNENASNPGQALINAGNVSGAYVRINTQGAARATFEHNGTNKFHTGRTQFSGNVTTGFTGKGVELGFGSIGIISSFDRDAGTFQDLQIAGATLSLLASGTTSVQVDNNATAGNTRLLIYDVDNGTLERVSVGAADSGGSGHKVLRIPN